MHEVWIKKEFFSYKRTLFDDQFSIIGFFFAFTKPHTANIIHTVWKI